MYLSSIAFLVVSSTARLGSMCIVSIGTDDHRCANWSKLWRRSLECKSRRTVNTRARVTCNKPEGRGLYVQFEPRHWSCLSGKCCGRPWVTVSVPLCISCPWDMCLGFVQNLLHACFIAVEAFFSIGSAHSRIILLICCVVRVQF